MRNRRTEKVIVLSVIALISLTNLVGISAAGISVVLGVLAFFVFVRFEKISIQESELSIKSIRDKAKKSNLWLWIVMPTIMNFLVIFFAKLFMPDYIEHVISRSEGMLSVSILPYLIAQLLLLALLEEIAWRGFFQKQLNTFLSFTPTLLISSVLFSLGHLTSGSLVIVIYDLVFVFVNSLFYGMIFKKTNNIWFNTLSHFIANLFAVIILFLL